MPLLQANNITLDELKLVKNDDSQEHDLRDTFTEFTVYEDVFSSVISAEVTISTALNIDGLLPFTGQDILKVGFESTPLAGSRSSGSSIEALFIVYKVETIPDIDKMASKTFKLYCMTPEGIQNEKIKINRRFEGEFTDTVERIFDAIDSPKEIVLDETKFKDKLLIPNWKPFKAINFIANRSLPSQSGTTAANYLFFERLKTGGGSEFMFTSVNTLISDASGGREFERSVITVQETASSNQKTRNIVSEYLINSNLDYLKDIQDGVLAGETHVIDLTRKRFDRYEHDYFEEFESYRTLENNAANAKSGGDIPKESNISLVPKHQGLYARERGTCDIESMPSSHVEESAWRRMLFMYKFENTKSTIKAPGDTSTRLGDVVTWDVPNTGGEDEQGNATNRYLNSKWLVTSIAHNVTAVDGYTQTIELVKDSFTEELPEANFENILKGQAARGNKSPITGGSSGAGSGGGTRGGGSGGSTGSGVSGGNPGQFDPDPILVLTSSSSSSSST